MIQYQNYHFITGSTIAMIQHLISNSSQYRGCCELRESSFNITRGGGDEDIEGGLRKFLNT